MKLYDNIEIVTDKYARKGIKKGAQGAIVLAEIRQNCFEVEFFNLPDDVYPLESININDMKVIKISNISDEIILKELPKNDPHWWCKVEDGYILNLLGERKNKIPYNYNS